MPWSVWVLSSEGARALPLPKCGEVCVGSEAEPPFRVQAPAVAAKHLELRTSEEGILYAKALGPILLNDVQLGGNPRLRAGDELVMGSVRLLVLEQMAVLNNPLRVRRDFESLREGAFATGGPLALLLAGVPARKDQRAFLRETTSQLPPNAFASELGPRTLEVLVPGLDEPSTGELARQLKELGASPVQGVHRAGLRAGLEETLEDLFAGYLGLAKGWVDEASYADPVMLRVLATLERQAIDRREWVLWGEPGSGKRTLARLAKERSAHPLSFEISEAADPPAHSSWVLPIPPLRDRPQDILVLAEAMLASVARATGKSTLSFTDSARKALLGHPFFGNVRELKNVVAAGVIASSGSDVSVECLPHQVQHAGGPLDSPESLRTALNEREREALLGTLSKTRWNVTRAAQLLNIPRRTVIYRMARLGLKRPAR